MNIRTHTPLFPLAGFETGHTVSGGAILLRLLYLAEGEEDQPFNGLLHAMSAVQARELGYVLLEEAMRMDHASPT
jgi:hypothetical protein